MHRAPCWLVDSCRYHHRLPVLQVWSGQQDLCRRQPSDFFKIVLTDSSIRGLFAPERGSATDLEQFTPYLRLISPRVLFLFADSGGSLRLQATAKLAVQRTRES